MSNDIWVGNGVCLVGMVTPSGVWLVDGSFWMFSVQDFLEQDA